MPTARTSAPAKQKAQDRPTQSLRLWLRLLACESIVKQHIRKNLRQEFNITLPQFDVMAELEYVGTPLTMSELSKKLMVSNGNVTGVIDRLERDGHVYRTPSKQDRRVQLIKLTDQGLTLFNTMAKRHKEWVAGIFNNSSLQDINQLTGLLQTVHEDLKGI